MTEGHALTSHGDKASGLLATLRAHRGIFEALHQAQLERGQEMREAFERIDERFAESRDRNLAKITYSIDMIVRSQEHIIATLTEALKRGPTRAGPAQRA